MKTRWINYAAAAWAVLFSAPHIWWALGFPWGFPGGEASHRFFFASAWRVVYDIVVIALGIVGFLVALTPARRISRVLAWIACGILLLRGVAGLIHDGTGDLVWNPTFVAGGLLFGGVAWTARTRRGHG